MEFLYAGTLCCLFGIGYQDIKHRAVTGLLLGLAGLFLGGMLYLHLDNRALWLTTVLLNLCLVALMLIPAYGYSRWIRKTRFWNRGLGTGDLFFFIAMALGFPTVTFLILLVASLVLALISGIILGYGRDTGSSIPLAGIQALFLSAVFLVSRFGSTSWLYRV